VGVDYHGPANGGKNAIGNLLRFGLVADIGQEDIKLVPADAGHGISGAYSLLKAFRRFDEIGISGAVADGVIDLLEAIQIDEQESEREGVLARLDDGGG
jgi:hypothetical protein